MGKAPVLVLIHSPLVGPLTWRSCSAALRSMDRSTLVPSLARVMDAEPPWIPKLAGRVVESLGEAPSRSDVALVVHSGAGALVPAIHAAARPRVTAAVFVDAVIPRPGRSWFDTAPPKLSQRLRELSQDGVLPPWDQWFPPDSIPSHLPDETLRSRFLAELPRLPLAYFEETAPEATGWDSMRCGYLRLSEAYEEAAREAADRGWPTHHEPSDHLAMVTQPETIAAALDRMLRQMGFH
jgi:alpha/beta hydrolase family protein